MKTRAWALWAAASLAGVGCGADEGADVPKAADAGYAVEVEQVRFTPQGVFPFDFLIGRAYVTAARPVPTNLTWWPDPDSTALRVFEDGVERPVLRITPFGAQPGKMNLMVVVPVTQPLAVGPAGEARFEPNLVRALQSLADGYEKNYYNLAITFCWGATERRYAFVSRDGLPDIRQELADLSFPGAPTGRYLDCIEPVLADLNWLQRADRAAAEEAARQRGTLPLFFAGDQNSRTQVLLLTDGIPFREGTLDRFSDLLVQGNLPLHTLALQVSAQGERGLTRLADLYQRRRLGGGQTLVPSHEQLVAGLEGLIDRWLSRQSSFVVEYLSGFSGERGAELSIWASWKDGQFTSRELRTAPGSYQGVLRWITRGLVVGALFGLLLYLLYRAQVWPFGGGPELVPCPEGCGHSIPERWPTCRFCELRGVWGRLVLLSGDRAGQIVYLKQESYVMGSAASDDVLLTHLKDYGVAPAHAELHRLEGGEKIALKVGGSGVTVLEREVPSGQVVNLSFGDVIQFGPKGVATILLRGVERLT